MKTILVFAFSIVIHSSLFSQNNMQFGLGASKQGEAAWYFNWMAKSTSKPITFRVGISQSPESFLFGAEHTYQVIYGNVGLLQRLFRSNSFLVLHAGPSYTSNDYNNKKGGGLLAAVQIVGKISSGFGIGIEYGYNLSSAGSQSLVQGFLHFGK